MKKKFPWYGWVSILSALFLEQITCVIGGFNFATAPLFSLYSLYGFVIFVIYGAIIQYVINKIMDKRS